MKRTVFIFSIIFCFSNNLEAMQRCKALGVFSDFLFIAAIKSKSLTLLRSYQAPKALIKHHSSGPDTSSEIWVDGPFIGASFFLNKAEAEGYSAYRRNLYHELSNELSGKGKYPESDSLLRLFVSALNRLPDHQSTEPLWREQIDTVPYEDLRPGQTFSLNRFWSTSTDSEKARSPERRANRPSIFFKIDSSSSGKPIYKLETLHGFGGENEVTFFPFTKFKVKKLEEGITPRGEVSKIITIDEIAPRFSQKSPGARGFFDLDIKDVMHVYNVTGYYPGPIHPSFAAERAKSVDYAELNGQKVVFEVGGTPVKQDDVALVLQKVGEGNNGEVFATSDGKTVVKYARPGKEPTFFVEGRISEFLRANFSLYKISVPKVTVTIRGSALLRKNIPQAALAKNIPNLSNHQANRLRVLWENARRFAIDTGIGLDIKAANLAWLDGDWQLFDLGPRMGYLPYGWTIDMPSFEVFRQSWRSFDPPIRDANHSIQDWLEYSSE